MGGMVFYAAYAESHTPHPEEKRTVAVRRGGWIARQ